MHRGDETFRGKQETVEPNAPCQRLYAVVDDALRLCFDHCDLYEIASVMFRQKVANYMRELDPCERSV